VVPSLGDVTVHLLDGLVTAFADHADGGESV
jgi:hypothetical protein